MVRNNQILKTAFYWPILLGADRVNHQVLSRQLYKFMKGIRYDVMPVTEDGCFRRCFSVLCPFTGLESTERDQTDKKAR